MKNHYRLVNWDIRNLNDLLGVVQWFCGTESITRQLSLTGLLVSSKSLLKALEGIQRNQNPLEVCSGFLDWKNCEGIDFEPYCQCSSSEFTHVFTCHAFTNWKCCQEVTRCFYRNSLGSFATVQRGQKIQALLHLFIFSYICREESEKSSVIQAFIGQMGDRQ